MLSFPDTDALSNAAIIAAEIVRAGGSFVIAVPEPQQITGGITNDAAFPEESSESLLSEERDGRISPSSYEDECSDSSDSDVDEGRRVAKSRERNREHARRTRLRKKAQLEALQSRIKGLRAEAEVLKQSLEECSLASILMGLSHKNKQDKITNSLLTIATDATSESCSKEADDIVELVGAKRKRFSSPDADENKSVSTQPLKLRVNGKVTYIGGGKSHINWKTGVYTDEHGVPRQLTHSQLESLRRERNRMHAKMTRDRKKNFIAIVERTIEDLESTNARMKLVLARAVDVHFHPNTECKAPAAISPVTPECTFVKASLDSVPSLCGERWFPPAAKRTCLG